MGVSSKLNEGKIYQFLKTALKMRRLQKHGAIGKEIVETVALFDAQLESILEDIDKIDTKRVIQKTGEL